MIVRHRFLLGGAKDIYSEQIVNAEVFACKGHKICVSRTNTFFQLTSRDNPNYDYVAFDMASGFPLAYGSSEERAFARAKTAINISIKKDKTSFDKAINDAVNYYGLANETEGITI